MINRTSTSSGLSSLVGSLRPTSHGGRAVASASVRSLDGAMGPEARSAAGAVNNNDNIGRRTHREFGILPHHQGGRPECRGLIGECGWGRVTHHQGQDHSSLTTLPEDKKRRRMDWQKSIENGLRRNMPV